MSAPTFSELPTEILFNICYDYISDEDVRNLNRIRNRRLVAITTSYLKHNKKLDILIVTPRHSESESQLDLGVIPPDKFDASSEIIRIRKSRNIWFAKIRYAASYPHKSQSSESKAQRVRYRTTGGFGGVLDGAYIVGNYQCVYQYEVDRDRWVDIDKKSHKKEPRKEYAKGCKIGDCFLVYGEKAEILQFKPWLNKVYDSFPNGFQNRNLKKDETRQSISKGIQASRSFPSIKQANSFETRTQMSSTVEHVGVRCQVNIQTKEHRPFWRKIVNRIATYSNPPTPVHMDQQQWQARRFLRSQWFCEKAYRYYGPFSPDDQNYSLINIEYDKVIFSVEGRIYMGQLSWDKQNVRWKMLESLPGSKRICYMIFKMKEYVYVIGGYVSDKRWPPYDDSIATLRCEKYNLKLDKWSTCRHKLPFPLKYASIAVAQDESYAVITGGLIGKNEAFDKYFHSNWIIVFEEETGFTILEDQMLRRRNNHVSIVIK